MSLKTFTNNHKHNVMMRKNFIVKASLFTLILAFMVAGTFAIAAVMNKKESKKEVLVNTQFRFTGASADYDEITNESNWEIDDGTKSCNPGTTLPCLVAPNMSSIFERNIQVIENKKTTIGFPLIVVHYKT